MDNYIYTERIAQSRSVSYELEGKTLKQFLVQVVEPEFNVAYLIFEDGSAYAVQGEFGSEILSIHWLSAIVAETKPGEKSRIKRFRPFEQFIGRRIEQVRMIGEAWNGHGFEFSFEGIANRTMIIQSIYTGQPPDDLFDCLRMGVGQYYLSDSSDI
jgi:hypothetical protein